jgi:hypothetical protein
MSSVDLFIKTRVLPEYRSIVKILRELMRECAPNAHQASRRVGCEIARQSSSWQSSCIHLMRFPRRGGVMPEKKTLQRARKAKRAGKSPSTQAGEFVREEIEHIREGKHGARSAKQAIAIGLSKARRAGVRLPPPKKGQASARTRGSAARDYRRGKTKRKPSAARSRASLRKLKREPRRAASTRALSRQAHSAAKRRRRTRT